VISTIKNQEVQILLPIVPIQEGSSSIAGRKTSAHLAGNVWLKPGASGCVPKERIYQMRRGFRPTKSGPPGTQEESFELQPVE